ncbi:hypothetical protein IKE99_01705 [Candidatus Saccharibacteria bacterium]|nr:hypothetical protein [Candidatus Saccharibacteria bacterium]
MGVIVNKENQQNDELSRRISADLRARAIAEAEGGEDVDLVEDARYLKDLKKTSKFGWIWIVLIVLATLSVISIIFL